MRFSKATIGAALCVPALCLQAVRSTAQGCIVARQCAPIFSADESPYLRPYHWTFDLSLRVLDASRHYNGTVEQVIRQTEHNNVINRQRILDLGGSYGLSKQSSVVVSVPVLLYGRWSIPLPTVPAGPRYALNANGLGDISVSVKSWVLPTAKNPTQNIAFSLGIEAPTGSPHETSPFPDLAGHNANVIRPVDQSIQPGLGAWAVPAAVQAYKSWKKVTFFASGTYLMSLSAHNGTPSIVSDLYDGSLPASIAYEKFNACPDQYLGRIGASTPVGKKKWGLTGELAYRIEGVPAVNVIGNNEGFRRPGYAQFAEPGLTWSHGSESWSVSVPVTLARNRIRDAHGNAGDATFADQFELISYSHRY